MAYDNIEIGGKKIFGTAGYSVQDDEGTPQFNWTLSSNPNDAYFNKVQLGTYLTDPSLGANGQKLVETLIQNGEATYDPTYGWVANRDAVNAWSTGLFGGSSMTSAIMDAAPYIGMIGAGAGLFGSGLLGGGLGGVEGALGAGEAVGGSLGGELGGAVGGSGGTFGSGTLGSGTFGLDGLGTNLLDPAVTGTTATGGTLGGGSAVGAGGAGSTFAPGSEIFNVGSGTTIPNVPTPSGTNSGTNTATTPGTGTGPGGLDWSKISEWGVNDWLKAFGPVGGALFDYFGDQSKSQSLTDWYNTAMNSPGMVRFNESFAPGFDLTKADPALQGAIDQSANAFTRAASARVGNVQGNPGAWDEIQTNVLNKTIAPWLYNYRGQNLQAAGMGASTAANFGNQASQYAGTGWDNAGGVLGYFGGQNQNQNTGILNNNALNYGGNTWRLA